MCTSCLSNIGKGKKYNCDKILAVKLLEKLLTVAKDREQIAPKIIATKCANKYQKELNLLQSIDTCNGKPLQVSIDLRKCIPREISLV